MAFPTIPVVVTAAIAATAYAFRSKISSILRPPGQGPIPGTVNKLTKGTTYAILIQLGGAATPNAPGHFTGVKEATDFLNSHFARNGFEILAPATLRDEEARTKFAAALPSTWVMKAKRTSSEPDVSEGHPLIGQALFTPLPTS